MALQKKKSCTRESRVDPASHVNYRFLTDDEKQEKLHLLHQNVRAANRKVENLRMNSPVSKGWCSVRRTIKT